MVYNKRKNVYIFEFGILEEKQMRDVCLDGYSIFN